MAQEQYQMLRAMAGSVTPPNPAVDVSTALRGQENAATYEMAGQVPNGAGGKSPFASTFGSSAKMTTVIATIGVILVLTLIGYLAWKR